MYNSRSDYIGSNRVISEAFMCRELLCAHKNIELSYERTMNKHKSRPGNNTKQIVRIMSNKSYVNSIEKK